MELSWKCLHLVATRWNGSSKATSLSQGYFPLWVGPRRRKPWKISSMPLSNQSTPDDRIWRSASRPSIGRRKCQSNRLLSDVTRDVIRRKTLPGTIMTVDTPLCPCHLTNSTRVLLALSLWGKLREATLDCVPLLWLCPASSVQHFGVEGPVQSKSMFISIDQLPKMIEFHTIIEHNYSSVDFIYILGDMSAAILKKETFF